MTDSNGVELEFMQNKYIVFLTEPLAFENKECRFIIYITTMSHVCNHSNINDENIFIPSNEEYTCITASYVSNTIFPKGTI